MSNHRFLFVALTAVTAFACSLEDIIWFPRSQSADPLFRFVRKGKAGYIDAQGTVVIPPALPAFGNSGPTFHDGLAQSSLTGKYVDKTGKLVLDLPLYIGSDFSEGLAAAIPKDENRWGYIDTNGKFAISPRFSRNPLGYVESFSDGMAMIFEEGKFGFIDRSGNFAIPLRYFDATNFAEGMSRVVIDGPCYYHSDLGCGPVTPGYPQLPRTGGTRATYPTKPCKFTYINKSGQVVAKQSFDFGRDFSEGLAPVEVGKLWGFIDKTGRFIISPKFEDARPFSSGLARIRVQRKYGYAGKSGEIVIEPQFEEADDFSEGFAAIGDGAGNHWYVNSRGQRAFLSIFEIASPFFKGLAHVKVRTENEKTFAYINHQGTRVFEYSISP